MWVSRYFVWFMIYSFMGWVYETTYVTIKNRKWENRGFLYGPICPIYGTGALAISVIMELLPAEQAASMVWWKIFLIAFFGSIVLEYSTSYTLEKLFHAYWWDYSHAPFNIKGRVCLPASIGFGCAGLLVVYVIYPFMQRLTGNLSVAWMELFSLLTMALLGADMALTVSALTDFNRMVQGVEESLNQHMDEFVANMDDRIQRTGNWLLEERERFSRESMERAVAHMTSARRLTIARVKGYHPQYTGKTMRQMLAILKGKLRRGDSEESETGYGSV